VNDDFEDKTEVVRVTRRIRGMRRTAIINAWVWSSMSMLLWWAFLFALSRLR
jgi:hypothetical protein